MSTADGLAEVARLVEQDGWPVEFVPGWRTRGRGPVVPRTVVNHWTAGPREGDHPSLRVVTYGRKGLRNALCNTYSSRRPKLYIVAARTAWHAGRGSWHGVSGNSPALGHEAENSGSGEWTAAHLDLIASLDRAQTAVFGFGVHMVCDHFEWTSRKIDRNDVGGPPWRERIRARPQPEEDELAELSDEAQRYFESQYKAAKQRGHGPNTGPHVDDIVIAARGQMDAHYGSRMDIQDPSDVGVKLAHGSNSGDRANETAKDKGFSLAQLIGKAADLVRRSE